MENSSRIGDEGNAELSLYDQLQLKKQAEEQENHFTFLDYYGQPIAKATDNGSSYIFQNGAWQQHELSTDEEFEAQALSEDQFFANYPETQASFRETIGSQEMHEERLMRKRLGWLLYPDLLLERFHEAILRYGAAEQENIQKALEFARVKHEGQYRHENTPYLSHCIDVALYAVEGREDAHGVIVLLLHDVLEDTDTTYEELVSKFEEAIANDVQALSKVRNGVEVPLNQYQETIASSTKLSRYKGFDRRSNALTLYFSPTGEWKTGYIQKTRTRIIPMVANSDTSLAESIESALRFVENNPIPTEMEQTRMEELRLTRK